MELQQPTQSGSPNGTSPEVTPVGESAVRPPLNVSGMVINKSDLLAALRLWVPQVWDISPLGDDRFVLEVGPIDPARARR